MWKSKTWNPCQLVLVLYLTLFLLYICKKLLELKLTQNLLHTVCISVGTIRDVMILQVSGTPCQNFCLSFPTYDVHNVNSSRCEFKCERLNSRISAPIVRFLCYLSLPISDIIGNSQA